MYNLSEYSSKYSAIYDYSYNYSDLWFYSKDEATNFNTDIANTNNFKSFTYKTKL